jgi:hypothetical protein
MLHIRQCHSSPDTLVALAITLQIDQSACPLWSNHFGWFGEVQPYLKQKKQKQQGRCDVLKLFVKQQSGLRAWRKAEPALLLGVLVE